MQPRVMPPMVMQRTVAIAALAAASACAAAAQALPPPPNPHPQAALEQPALTSGGKLHGVVKSGNTPLPGVAVSAQNTLTGKRYSTVTGITGAWALAIPLDGRYVVRTQFAAFAAGSAQALLNAANRDQSVNFDLMLASRAARIENRLQGEESGLGSDAIQAIRQMAANGAQSLSLMSTFSAGDESLGGGGATPGASLPSIAGNADFGADSVAISGQTGQVSPLAGLDMDRIRDAVESFRAQNGGQPGAASGPPGAPGAQGGILVFNSPGAGPGGIAGGFGGGPGGGGGGRMNFRGFNPGQPHGAIFWTGSNSALNALPFALNGQPQIQPASGTNRFGITFMSAPYIPRVTKPSGKDGVFFTLSGTRSSSPVDQYATVPTEAERSGDFSAPGLPAIFDPATGLQFQDPISGQMNVIPKTKIAAQATALLCPDTGVAAVGCTSYFPQPNIAPTGSSGYNYHLLTTGQSNATQLGARYMRALGKNATLLGSRGGRRSQSAQGLRQSVNLNYNWSHTAQDDVAIFPLLGGNGQTDGQSLQAGYTVGYKKVTSIFNAAWNRSKSQTTNYFTNRADVATAVGFLGPNGAALNTDPLNFGLPGITLSQFTGLGEQQPAFTTLQTISASEVLSWIHGKHNLRFGGDYRRVHRDFLGGSNSTGDFTFSGVFTRQNSDPATGSALADFLLGLPQQTTIDSSAQKSYLRQNVMDLFAQDDWRALPNLTLLYGLRYEFFSPYSEKFGHLAFVQASSIGATPFAGLMEVQSGAPGQSLPASLVFPFRLGFAPRAGFALRLPRQTVLRGGFGMNYTNSQFAGFATAMALQPMVTDPGFVNEQSNLAATAGQLTLTDGFPAPNTLGNYALDPHYRLPYVEVWNLDVQKTLPWGLVLNAGYNGAKGNHLDITIAPHASPSSPLTNPHAVPFNYEQAAAFSKFNAGTLRLNKRLSKGVALGANYQYSHSIDNAGSVGGTSSVVAQNWQDLAAEDGNSSFDVRHKVSGTYLFELPFGQDKLWLSSGAASHIFEGFSISGSFVFATGTPLTPSYAVASSDVARGTAGTLRPNLVAGASPIEGGGSLKNWFNTAAYIQPQADAYGNAFGNASRNSIPGPGTVQNNMSLSKTMQLGETRSMEFRATASNVFNTVQYAKVDARLDSATAGQVTSAGSMRSFQFMARFRF